MTDSSEAAPTPAYRVDWDDAYRLACRESEIRYIAVSLPEEGKKKPRPTSPTI